MQPITDSLSEIERLINQGRFFEARTLAESSLRESDTTRLRQLLALAMSKSGMSEPAREILEPVYKQDSADPETAGILGSIYKRLFKKTQDNRFAVLARTTYQQNFTTTRNYYTGINSASMATISGKASEGRLIAREVIAMLRPTTEDFWEQATLGEAFLLSKDKPTALSHYFQARKLAGKEWGKLQSVYDQLLLLNYFMAIPPELLKAFAPPSIIAFTGHMIDHPDRADQRFPPPIEKSIKDGISSAIRTVGASIGYCSLSCGSDILFAEAMAETDGEVHLFLPFNREDYIRESVQFAGDHWVDRFENLERKFPITYVTRERYTGNDDLFSFQNRVILGTVVLRAAMNFTTPTLLTVLSDTDLRQKEGGTRDTLKMWPYKDHHFNINPDNYREKQARGEDIAHEKHLSVQRDNRHISYVVIADLPGASENDIKGFMDFIDNLKSHLLIKPYFDRMDKEFTAVFLQPVSAMEMVKNMAAWRKAFGQPILPRISMHAVVLDSASPVMEDFADAIAFHLITPVGVPSAYGWFAAATTLSSDAWVMEFAGIVGDSFKQPNEVYSVSFKR